MQRHKFEYIFFQLAVYSLTSILLVPFFIHFPYLIHKHWMEVSLTSKIPIVSYALVIWFAVTMILFIIWLFKQFYRLTMLKRLEVVNSTIIGIVLLPGIIFFCYFIPLLLLSK